MNWSECDPQREGYRQLPSCFLIHYQNFGKDPCPGPDTSAPMTSTALNA
jgi:hypothetical protein